MTSCANCDATFGKKPDNRGVYRFSLENKLPSSGQSAREALGSLTGSGFTPVAKKSQGQFLCPSCWSVLNNTIKYQTCMKEFLGRTHSSTYIGGKRKEASILEVSAKKPRYTSTPFRKEGAAKKSLFRTSANRGTKWEAIITAIRARQYGRAIRGLITASKGTKRQFLRVLSDIIRKEVNQLLKSDTQFPLCSDPNLSNIGNFSWDSTLTKFQEAAPVLSTTLRSAVTKKDDENLIRGKTVNLKPMLGSSIACLLHAKAPKKCSFIPTIFSIQFWRGGLKRETIKQLAHAGICIGYKATLSAIDRIRLDFDAAAKSCKTAIEEQLSSKEQPGNSITTDQEHELSIAVAATAPNIDDEINGPSDGEDSILYSDGDDKNDDNKQALDDDNLDDDLDDDDDTSDDDDDDEQAKRQESTILYSEDEDTSDIADTSAIADDGDPKILNPGFTFCWDNVGKKITTRHPSQTTSNKYLNMALGYLAINRVPSTHCEWQNDQLVKAKDLSTRTFIPNENDIKSLKDRMKVIVGRIITRHLSWFRDNFQTCSVPHIVHEHTNESTEKSVLVNLGVFNENPSSTQGAIGIYDRLQEYVPSINSKPYTCLVYGDGLSCERGNDAHNARANGLDPWERLEGLEPAAQEFHKEMLLLQDFYDEFFKGASVGDKGTLSQIKNIFNYRNVKSDISDNFNHAWELMCLVTEGFVCLLTMKTYGLLDKCSRPSNAPDKIEESSRDEKEKYFEEVCSSVVDRLWHELDTNAVNTDDGTEPPVYCCGEDKDEDFISCGERMNCPNGEIFHYSCAGIDPANFPTETWYCSDDCQNRSSFYRYCHCHQDLGIDEPMIGCSAEKQCIGEEWYHCKCVDIDANNVPEEDWFCRIACRKKVAKSTRRKGRKRAAAPPEDTCDYVYSYSRAITWCGLNLLCRRDAVREGDGEAMLSYWKLDLIHFFASRHPKYLILAHRLSASVNGWLPEKLRLELTWNRTVNYGGGIGRNLPMDLMNEILNRLFKNLLDAAKGQYTGSTLDRCGQIVGPLGEALDNLFDSNIIENEIYRHRRRDVNRDKNVAQLIKLLQPNDLFSYSCGRRHRAFPEFTHNENPITPGKFPGKMKQLSKTLDKRRLIVLNH